MHTIELKEIRVFAYHGCLPEETIIGSDYTVDVKLFANLLNACKTDHLVDTIDYVIVNSIVKEQMAVPSKLIENVALRIAEKLKITFSSLEKVEIKVIKINPPINGDVKHVAFTISI
jgi:7,8-dihydroneopterin aldolase/epimerase/oxygenase